MLAFAKIVMEKVVNKNKQSTYFDGITMVVLAYKEMYSSPQHHSTVGQKLLLVDWEKMYGLKVTCPCCKQACLDKDRTNFSKNKILFPIFHLQGPPSWCMAMGLECSICKSRCCVQPTMASYFVVKLPTSVRGCHISCGIEVCNARQE